MGARVLLAAGVGLVALTGCGGAPRAFVADQQVRFTSPAPLAVVSTPFAVRWTSTRSDARYAVFVDLVPVGPGHALRDVADDQCRKLRGCPDSAYLANLGVFVTDRPEVEIPLLPILKGTAARARHPVHTITVVALDRRGRRTGDASWQLEVRA